MTVEYPPVSLPDYKSTNISDFAKVGLQVEKKSEGATIIRDNDGNYLTISDLTPDTLRVQALFGTKVAKISYLSTKEQETDYNGMVHPKMVYLYYYNNQFYTAKTFENQRAAIRDQMNTLAINEYLQQNSLTIQVSATTKKLSRDFVDVYQLDFFNEYDLKTNGINATPIYSTGFNYDYANYTHIAIDYPVWDSSGMPRGASDLVVICTKHDRTIKKINVTEEVLKSTPHSKKSDHERYGREYSLSIGSAEGYKSNDSDGHSAPMDILKVTSEKILLPS